MYSFYRSFFCISISKLGLLEFTSRRFCLQWKLRCQCCQSKTHFWKKSIFLYAYKDKTLFIFRYMQNVIISSIVDIFNKEDKQQFVCFIWLRSLVEKRYLEIIDLFLILLQILFVNTHIVNTQYKVSQFIDLFCLLILLMIVVISVKQHDN